MGKTHPGGRRPDDGHLSLQANVICWLLFLIGVAAIVQHPTWFQ
jgi:hypothetical protein